MQTSKKPQVVAGATADQLILGLDSFGDVTVDNEGTPVHHAQVLRDVVEQAVLADELGVDAITLGEHHRDDFAISSPEIVLAAIAGKTERILLGTGVTVLSSDDPVRVYERFATLDGVSNGRAEVILGRGSFTESFPLFGYELSDYDSLFAEKLDLFSKLRSEGPITWSGKHRSTLVNQEVYPKTEHEGGLPAWIGVGGSPQSVLRTVQMQIPMMLAIIGGDPARFLPFADLYRSAQQELGSAPMPLGVHSPGHVAKTDEQARDELWEHFRANRIRIGRERGWPDPTREQFEAEVEQGALFTGSPETVAQKIAKTVKVLGADRFDLKYANGTMPHDLLMSSIDLYGREVIPRVRELLS
ncbi:LLM class flavin-dependent oxidoreductase [Leucobacter denitrificans]|uniref:LLM class flavin-dependent oxidoreductase n=1 Tax=Leucobacter denitrificans TaxID=683042 RepID=A0A7G9S784_9MICO|nr:LLM class flavin-dependent oxidoreductase [Leucobacter denitrificans]QNN63709.1 LLM class flavin-dependent oxidoreductase [Leucobacter denitrificans]